MYAICRLGKNVEEAEWCGVMKATIRLTIGLLSSLLLSAGFSRAAIRLDPLSHQLGSADTTCSDDDPSGPCSLPSQYVTHMNDGTELPNVNRPD